MKSLTLTAFFAAFLLFPSCKKAVSTTSSTQTGNAASDTATVYVAGGLFTTDPANGATIGYAILWKNGVALPLTFYPFSYADAVVVNGSDVYIGGVNTSGSGYSDAATYWKNDVPVPLATADFGDQVNAMAVNGSDVYAAGFLTGANQVLTPAWWKNGAQQPLSGFTDNAYAAGIAVNGQDVYVAGGTNTNIPVAQNYQAIYWKNGAAVQLTFKDYTRGLYTAGIAIAPAQQTLKN